MRLYLINPSNPLVSIVNVKESRWNRYRVWKPLSLMVLAGLSPSEWEITIVDENLSAPNYEAMPRPDLVGITAFTSQANRYGVDNLNALFLTPLPGTRLCDQMKSEDRIALDTYPEGWKYYTLTFPVARYKNFSMADIIDEMISCDHSGHAGKEGILIHGQEFGSASGIKKKGTLYKERRSRR